MDENPEWRQGVLEALAELMQQGGPVQFPPFCPDGPVGRFLSGSVQGLEASLGNNDREDQREGKRHEGPRGKGARGARRRRAGAALSREEGCQALR